MVADSQHEMARTRALLTERERKVLAGEGGDSDDLRYVKWEVRNRIDDEVPHDIEVLAEHFPDALEELREAICEDDTESTEEALCPQCGKILERGTSDDRGEFFCSNCNVLWPEEDVAKQA